MQRRTQCLAPDFSTNDRGEFRLVTVPGRYYLQARAPLFNRAGGGQKPEQRDGIPLEPYRATLYHSTTVKGLATPVDAVGGKETAGLEIRLSRQPGGIVRGAPVPGGRPHVIAQWGATPQAFTSSHSVTADSDGHFAIPEVQAGFYPSMRFGTPGRRWSAGL